MGGMLQCAVRFPGEVESFADADGAHPRFDVSITRGKPFNGDEGSFSSAPASGQAQSAFDGGGAADGSSARTTAPRTSAPPKVTTTAAPVGRSNLKDPHRPAIDTVAPSVQAMSRRSRSREVNSDENTAGTIRKEKTSSTPAMCTLEVMTAPNDA